MAQISRYWTGKTSTGALGDAGPYSAEQFREFVSRILNGAEQANRGVIREVENRLAVTPNSPTAKNVLVDTGAAVVQGGWYHNDAQETVTIAANVSGSTRIDIIVLSSDYVAQEIRLAVVQGTAGAGFPAISQIAGVLWQIPLAYITLASGYSTVTASMITDWREYANIPSALGVDCLNGDVVTMEVGTVVIPGNGTSNQLQRTLSVASLVGGVIERRVLENENGRMLISGIVPVLCSVSVAAGDGLIPSSTAGQAMIGTGHRQFGYVLVANSGAGTNCLAFIHCFPRTIPAARVYNNANISIPDATSTALTFNSERYDNGAIHSTSVNTERLTCVAPGKYTVTGNIEFEATTSTPIVRIRLNGATIIASNSGGILLSVSTDIDLVAGDYVELLVQHTSGGAKNIVASGSILPGFMMHQSGN